MSGLERFQEHLRGLFQLDTADLDFGIYRLFAARREEVERFINEELPASVDAAFSDLLDGEGKGAAQKMEELAAQIISEAEDDRAILPDGKIKPDCADKAGKTLKTLIAEYEELRRKTQEKASLEEQKDDTYNHLYAFFFRYYDEGDFIPRHFFGARNRYVVPYNGEETLFHWANRDQYYVKSGENFRDYAFQADTVAGSWRIQFKIVEASTPPGNTKGDTRFFFPQIASIEVDHESKHVTIPFHYRLPTEQEVKKFGPKSKGQAALLREAAPAIVKAVSDPMLAGVLGQPVHETEKETLTFLDKRLRHFTRKNTTDFFVHKRLREFLLDELEFYIRDQVVHLMDMDADAATLERKRLSVRVFRRLSERIIDFLARIEDAQKTLFEKKKFALAADYLMPIQHVPEDFREEVLSNKAQIRQWKDWYSIKPKKDLFNQKGEINRIFLEQHPTLTVDTRLFDPDFKLRLLVALSDHFGDLDEATDGLLIHSENFQALNYLLPRYEGEVKCIYIDPPYNTGSDEFIYKDSYQKSSWISMLSDRLSVTKGILRPEGSIFINIDDNELHDLWGICSLVFGPQNFLANIIWQKIFSAKNTAKYFSGDHDYIISFARNRSVWVPNLLPREGNAEKRYTNPDNDPRGPWSSSDLTARNYYSLGQYQVTGPKGKIFSPAMGTYWRVNHEKFQELDRDGRIWWGKSKTNMPRLKRFLSEVKKGIVPQTLWGHREVGNTQEAKKELLSIIRFNRPEDVLNTVKPVRLLRRVLQIATDTGSSILLDFFAGSGPSGHSVIDLNREDGGRRKFILVEMGDYFDTVLVPRITKVMYTPEWKEGKPKRMATQEEAERMPRLVKIVKLESYEDALHNLTKADQLKGLPKVDVDGGARRISYVLERLMEKSDSMLNWEALDRPFDYTMEVLSDQGVRTSPVDLVETFNALYGLRVQQFDVWQDPETLREYRVIKAAKADGGKVLVIWRNVPPENEAARDRAFLEAHIGDLGEWNEAWVNGPCAMPGLKPLDGMFKQLVTGFRN